MAPANLCRKREPGVGDTAEYICHDVKITKLIHEYGQQHKKLHYTNRFGKKMTVPVSW